MSVFSDVNLDGMREALEGDERLAEYYASSMRVFPEKKAAQDEFHRTFSRLSELYHRQAKKDHLNPQVLSALKSAYNQLAKVAIHV